MSIDFTALDNIQENEPQKAVLRASDNEEVYSQPETGKALRSENRASQEVPNSLMKEKQERENRREAYRSYQRNIKRSEELRREIAKGINAGADPEILFLKAVECIYRMTGDTAFYNHCKAGMKQDTGADTKQA